MNDIVEIHEFFVEGNNQGRSHVLLHITEPSTPEEMAKGYFFAVAEINNGTTEQIEHLQQMIDDLESGYYETDEKNGRDAFESTLEFINRRGHHILQYSNSLTHCLVGVLRDHSISFAYHGQPQALLFYQNKNQEWEHINIIEDSGPEEKNNQLFSSMLQGNINEGDFLYVASPHVNDYFTFDRIQKIIISKTTRQSAEHIQKVLTDLNNELSFGGIIFHYPTKTQIPKTGKQPRGSERGSEASLNRMLEQEKTTEEMLSPPIVGNIRGGFREFWQERKEIKKQKKLAKIQEQRKRKQEATQQGLVETNYRTHGQAEERGSSDVLVAIGRIIVNIFAIIFKTIKSIVIGTGKIFLSGFIMASNYGGQREVVVKEIKEKIDRKKDWLAEMPITSRILLIATAILMIFFIASLMYFKIREGYNVKQQAYNNLIQAIIDKKDAADASIIYKDDSRALALFQEARDMISQLPDKGKAEKEKITQISGEIDSGLMKLRKLNIITPELVADLSKTNLEAKTQKLAMIDNSLVAYSADDINFYKVNTDSRQVEQKIHNTFPHLLAADTPKENDKIVFATGKDSVATYNKDSTTLSQSDISFGHDNVQITDLVIYNLRAYILDPANKQVYKHNPTQTGYDKGAGWIKDNSDISDAVSLAIDGDAYVLKNNGEVYKYQSGIKTNFSITGLDPTLQNPLKIWTYNNVENIYVLEPSGKRVIILDKNGKLINQYTAAEWQNPTGMIVREDQKTIYILDNNKVYKFKF